MSLKINKPEDLNEIVNYIVEAVKQTPSKKYPRFWDLKDLVCHFENDNGFDYKVRAKVWNEMGGYQMPKTKKNITKLLTSLVEANHK